MKIHEETKIQIQVCEWVKQQTTIPFLHVANERKTSPMMGALLKRMGVRAGVSDLFFPRGNKTFSGLWLELKAPNGKVSPVQAKFMCDMVNEGYCCQIAYSPAEAICMIKAFYGMLSSQ